MEHGDGEPSSFKCEELSNQLRDRLSELPLSIIHDILGRAPMTSAVRMSVLSREWRYTWTTLPFLNFKPHGDPRDKFNTSTKNFINNVLLHHEGPIHTFKVSYKCSSSVGSIENWLLCLASKDVKKVFLRFSPLGDGSLGSNVYKCLKLTDLDVWYFRMSPPPSTFKGFLFLTGIGLVAAKLSDAGFKSLVSHCPVLEELALLHCSIKELTISSPNLKDLHITGCHEKLSLDAPKLEKIHVDLLVWHGLDDTQSTLCNYTNLLGSCTDLVELSGNRFFTRYLSVGLESCLSTSVFQKLKVIELVGSSFFDTSEIAVVARLIRDAPNLHKLYVNSCFRPAEDRAPDVCFREYFGFAPSFTHEKLKEVKLTSVCHYPTGIQLVKFLLETSSVLETMELRLAISHVDKVSAKVLGFDKASPNAKIAVTTQLYFTRGDSNKL